MDALGGVYMAAKAVGLVPAAHLPLTLLTVKHGAAQHSLLRRAGNMVQHKHRR